MKRTIRGKSFAAEFADFILKSRFAGNAFLADCSLFTSAAAAPRTWTSADGGKTFDGEIKSYDAANGIVIVTTGGKEIRFAVDKLSAADIDFIK